MQHHKKNQQSGFTLIELLVTVTLISIFAVTYLNAYTANISISKYTRLKTLAASLAQEKMESLKNLTYDALSTQNGAILPQGAIPDSEIIVRNNKNFLVKTTIVFYDDPYDGCAIYVDTANSQCADGANSNKPQDLFVDDYKKITIKIFNQEESKLYAETSTSIASHAAETPTDTGILAISVIDASGNNVPEAIINLTNDKVSPIINISTSSSQDALTLIPKLPPSESKYHIEVSKPGYNASSTYPITQENPTPNPPDASIIIQKVSYITLVIDKISSLRIYTQNESGETPLANQSFTISSLKSIDTDGLIPKYNANLSTNENGFVEINNLEWGSYNITLPNIYIISSSPYLPIGLNPNETKDIYIKLSSDPTLLRISSLIPTSISKNKELFTLSGENLNLISSIIASKPEQTDIPATDSVLAPDGKSATFYLDLTSAEIGIWILKIAKEGQELIQNNAFTVN